MTSVPDLTQTLQTLLTTTADDLATCTGGIRRHRKFSGASLVQTRVLGWLQQPTASLPQWRRPAEWPALPTAVITA